MEMPKNYVSYWFPPYFYPNLWFGTLVKKYGTAKGGGIKEMIFMECIYPFFKIGNYSSKMNEGVDYHQFFDTKGNGGHKLSLSKST